MNVKEVTTRIKVSYINKGLKSDGKPLESSNGDTMQIVSLKDALNRIRQLSNENIDNVKGEYGALYCMPMEKQLDIEYIRKNHCKSGGAMFVDIDHIEEYMDIIYNDFENICSEIPNIIAIVSSHSGKGYHIFVWTEQLEDSEYRKTYENMCCLFAEYFEERFGISLAPTKYMSEDGIEREKKMIDLHNATIKQKFYISASKYIKINPSPKLIDFSDEDVIKEIDKYRKKYPYCVKPNENRDYLLDMNVIDIHSDWNFDVVVKEMPEDYIVPKYLQHLERMNLYSSLQFLFGTKEKTNEEWEKCAKMLDIGDHHTYKDFEDEPTRNKWFKRNEDWIKAENNLTCNTDLLKLFGYEVIWISPKNKNIGEDTLISMLF